MEDLTFGEQVKIILGRKGMTIKQLAELIEVRTGKKMSRQNLTQRLGRDNFQEQDMRMIAGILDCPFHLSIMSEAPVQQRSTAALERAAAARTDAVERRQAEDAARAGQPESEETAQTERLRTQEEAVQTESLQAQEEAVQTESPQAQANAALTEEPAAQQSREPETAADERDMTIGELYEIHQELAELEENAKAGEPVEEIKKELEKPKKERFGGIFLRRKHRAEEPREEEPVQQPQEETAEDQSAYAEPETDAGEQAAGGTAPAEERREDFAEEDKEAGEINPYTGREYQSNSVRMHPTRIGYVQVYDRTIHKWTDMTEWAFLGLQERKKALLGKAYEPPIYLD